MKHSRRLKSFAGLASVKRLALQRMSLLMLVLWGSVFVVSSVAVSQSIVSSFSVVDITQTFPATYYKNPEIGFSYIDRNNKKSSRYVPVGTAWVEAKAVPRAVWRKNDYALILSWIVSGSGYVQSFETDGISNKSLDALDQNTKSRLAIVADKHGKEYVSALVKSGGSDVVVYNYSSIFWIATIVCSTIIWLGYHAISLYFNIKSDIRKKRGHCGNCGYPRLPGSDKCSECGHVYC